MSENNNGNQKIKDMVKKYIEDNKITAKDVKNAFKVISMYYYYRVLVEGARPVDVVLEVNPDLSDVKNVASILSVWRNIMYRYMQEVATTIKSLTPESEMHLNVNDPMSIFKYMMLQRQQPNKEENVDIEDFEIKEINDEVLKKSIEKVKKLESGEKEEQQQ